MSPGQFRNCKVPRRTWYFFFFFTRVLVLPNLCEPPVLFDRPKLAGLKVIMQCTHLTIAGADVNAADRYGCTPLADAVRFSHDEYASNPFSSVIAIY